MYKRWAPPSDKRRLQYWLAIIKRAKTWQLLLVLIVLIFVTATLLRLNNIGMIEHRKAVETADIAGDKATIKQTLVELQRYVSAHMNTSLGKGVYLSKSYVRDYDAAIAAAANAHNASSDTYQKASVECRAKWQGNVASFRNDYVACVAAAVANIPAAQQNVSLPQPVNYQYNFASPTLSFDLAGLFVVASGILFMVIILRIFTLLLLRWLIRSRRNIV